jgi:hypothetical protein
MSNKNWWGPPDDDTEPLPAWMNPETYRNPKPKVKYYKSIEESIQEALKKPPVDLSFVNKEIK